MPYYIFDNNIDREVFSVKVKNWPAAGSLTNE